jgi:hypothetical protein
MIRMDN